MTTTETDPTTTTTVPTPYGPVAGTVADGVHVFRGVPFAASTEGAKRFTPPVDPEPWTEPLTCVAPGPAAPQNPSILEASLGVEGLTYGEDCLRANVFSPDLEGSASVMVWLHGGGFETGTASMSWYDGSALARRGVVVVALGYRLGALGYLDLPGVPGSGCFGLLDQVHGLRWVRDAVAAFGGDPDRVTVFGESAGAMSIGALLACEAADGLFHRAILQSGAAQNVQAPETAADVATKLWAATGLEPGDLDGLRALPLDQLLAAQGTVGREGDAGDVGLPWQPVLGSEAVPRVPLEAIRDGSADGIALLVGTTLEEMKLFPLLTPSLGQIDDEGLVARAAAYEGLMGRPPGSLLAAYEQRMQGSSPVDRWLALLTDLVFRIPAIRLAEAVGARGGEAHMYLFAERSDAFDGLLGSCHALDLPFSWDNVDAPGTEIMVGEIHAERRALARRMADAWAAFAGGAADPRPGDGPAWPGYEPGARATMWLAADRIEVVEDPFGTERRWWDGLDAGLGFDLSTMA
ncbi:MAG TPA: carboxylesterase family protein [Iamia sp.]|jgi:para-nitrobenzyl esterase|nr:carboxylesterase family protein [Iamia sp.]